MLSMCCPLGSKAASSRSVRNGRKQNGASVRNGWKRTLTLAAVQVLPQSAVDVPFDGTFPEDCNLLVWPGGRRLFITIAERPR